VHVHAICERVIDRHPSYQWVKHLYIDDPISSLDDNNAIALACDLQYFSAKPQLAEAPTASQIRLETVFSSHHAFLQRDVQ